MIERLFHVRAAGSTVRTELLGGLTTFLTMAYIMFVNPAIICATFDSPPRPTGISFEAAIVATCLSAAAATYLMGFLANYPIALAPGMGENAFFVGVVMALAAAKVANPAATALGIVFISGIAFVIVSILPFRRALIEAVPPSLRSGIAAGIGLFIAFIGLTNAGVIVKHPVTLVQFNHDVGRPETVIFFAGLVVTAVLMARRIRGAILIGIVFATAVALLWGKTTFTGIAKLPSEHAFFRLDLRAALDPRWIGFILVFLFMDVFDTTGTLIGVGEAGGFIRDGRLPRAGRAFLSDAVGTVVGAVTGTSTVTSYIESASGVAYGARTGLANVATGGLFLVALLFSPLAAMVGGYKPITAPALLLVGVLMVRNVLRIDWADLGEAVPAFLAMVGIPLTYSIADGLALGFVSYPVIKVLAGKARQVSWLMYLVLALFLLRYLFLK